MTTTPDPVPKTDHDCLPTILIRLPTGETVRATPDELQQMVIDGRAPAWLLARNLRHKREEEKRRHKRP